MLEKCATALIASVGLVSSAGAVRADTYEAGATFQAQNGAEEAQLMRNATNGNITSSSATTITVGTCQQF
jgi:hypothetical protein